MKVDKTGLLICRNIREFSDLEFLFWPVNFIPRPKGKLFLH